jgi:putative transposase
LPRGKTVADAVKKIGVTEQSYYRSERKCGGLRIDHAKRLKKHKQEKSRLKRGLADVDFKRFWREHPLPKRYLTVETHPRDVA